MNLYILKYNTLFSKIEQKRGAKKGKKVHKNAVGRF